MTFTLTADRPELFAAPPQLARDGTLTFTPAPGAYGIGNVTVIARNEGGVANGGADTSTPKTFTVRIASLPTINAGALGDGGFVWLQVNAPVRSSLTGVTQDGSPVNLQILEGPYWLA